MENREFENNLIERISMEQSIDKVWDNLTDMQAAILYLLMIGYSRPEITKHFECSRQNIEQRISDIRKKFIECGVYYE